MEHQILLRVVTKLLLPFIVLFGLYVIVHGELSPGGGFQGGVLIAVGFILYGIVFGRDDLEKLLPHQVSDLLAAAGVLVYAGTGFACLFAGGHFLDYRALFPTWPALGLSLVEYGVGITVSMVMVTIYNKITEPGPGMDEETPA
jgi:multicomponent Na+:H+ antiporter subunit B